MTEMEVPRSMNPPAPPLSIGDRVHYRPAPDERDMGIEHPSQPMAATVCYVFAGTQLVNLEVVDHYCQRHVRKGVTVWPSHYGRPPNGDEFCFRPA